MQADCLQSLSFMYFSSPEIKILYRILENGSASGGQKTRKMGLPDGRKSFKIGLPFRQIPACVTDR